MKKLLYSVSIFIISLIVVISHKAEKAHSTLVILGEKPVSQNERGMAPTMALGMVSSLPEAFTQPRDALNLFPSQKEKIERRKTLSDPENIKRAFSTLLSHNGEFKMSEEQNRIRAIQFLGTAVQDKDNAERDRILDQISEFVQMDDVSNIEDKRLQRSLVGDKVALIHLMMKLEPEKAESLFSKVESPWLQKIVTFARGRYAFFSHN